MTQDKDKVEYISEEEGGEKADKKVKKIKNELKACRKERAEYLAGWQRAKADYINLQREHEQKIADYFKFANESLILELLAVLDSFEAALKNGPKDAERLGQDGIKQLYNQLLKTLKSNGLEEIKALGEKFNPEFHEVIEVVKSDKEKGTCPEPVERVIVEEVQKGYTLRGKVIRPSKVKIGKLELKINNN